MQSIFGKLNDDQAIDATAISLGYQNGELTPCDVIDRALEKAKKTDTIFISLLTDRAQREAQAASQRWKDKCPLSPFDGVPISWKDLFDVKGSITTAGSATRLDRAQAEKDAQQVSILTQAGMINLGKTNLSEFAFSGLGINPHFGTPTLLSPTGSYHIPGGSSSGAALSVSQGIVPIAMGTDTAGSIRIPAAFNGLVGFRSSRNRYPLDGVTSLSPNFDTSGPLCRSMRDVIQLDQLLTRRQAPTTPLPINRILLRVDDSLLSQCSPDITAAFLNSLKLLQAKGIQIEHAPLPSLHHCLDLFETFGWPGGIEAFAEHEDLLSSSASKKMDPFIRHRLVESGKRPSSHLIRLYQARRQLQKRLNKELDGAVLVTPTVLHGCPKLDGLTTDLTLFQHTNQQTLRFTMPGSYLDMPGISLPSGVDANGLDTGLLFSMPSEHDHQLLRVALTIETVLRAKHTTTHS